MRIGDFAQTKIPIESMKKLHKFLIYSIIKFNKMKQKYILKNMSRNIKA